MKAAMNQDGTRDFTGETDLSGTLYPVEKKPQAAAEELAMDEMPKAAAEPQDNGNKEEATEARK